jgi:CheY-like chemotaxis protein
MCDPRQAENLAIIRRSGEHLLALINQVLDLSKIESGHITLDKRNFDLYHMLSELEDMFRVQADRNGLQLVFGCSEDVPRYIRTDEVRLRQVLINLLNNAVKFTKQGCVKLTAGTAASEDGPAEIRKLTFEIEDSGPGIASQELDNLFEAFAQTETGRQAHEGTGLGLSISKKFVQLMGGDMRCRSELGRGTAFGFDIEISLADLSEIETVPAACYAVGLESGQPCYRILIADDKPNNRKMLFRLLEPFGFGLREAADGEEAFEIWKRWKPHLIWMDIRMPVLNGYETAKQIRDAELKMKNEEEPRAVIIAVSASSFKEEHGTAISQGCDDFLRKPFREADIFDVMCRHLGIRFVYEENRKQESKDTARGTLLTREALCVLPDDLLVKFRKAADIADIDTALDLTGQIRESHESLANALAALLNDFRFDTLQELFGKGD